MVTPVPAVDLLFEAVAQKGHVCVGLDTAAEYVPPAEREKARNDGEAVLSYNKALIDATLDIAACYKVQIAYYEEMGIAGLTAYSQTLKYIRGKKSLVISDIKRGDIADTAKRYAKAHFSGDFETDFVTLNPYMGMDSIMPWLSEAETGGKGAFILMRTSNPGMKDFEYLEINNGKRVYNAVGDKLSNLATKRTKCGYGLFGAVIGCTEREEAAKIRKEYPDLFFLIPGYGAQGGGAQDAAVLLKDGNGGVVNASRSVITAWQKGKEDEKTVNNALASEYARHAAEKMRDEIKEALK
ncbi:MAG: orotidine-5'-phosphate decarboxylase [Treponema sp.]|nr:orotidine-5'-phosphate decarboxylase [Treponema sp.]